MENLAKKLTINDIKNNLTLAWINSLGSNDDETKVGAVIDAYIPQFDFRHVVSYGCNSFVKKRKLGYTLPCSGDDKHKYMLHAETVALLNFPSRNQFKVVEDFVAYSTLSPCLKCLRELVNFGVKVIIFKDWHRKIKVEDYLNCEIPLSISDLQITNFFNEKMELTIIKIED